MLFRFPVEKGGPETSPTRVEGPLFVIAGSAPESAPEQLKECVPSGARVLAADGGLRLCRHLGLKPEVLIGDFDTVTQAELAQCRKEDIEISGHPMEKDESDLELAIHLAHQRGAQRITLLGVLGGAWDHSMVNLLAPLSLCRHFGIWARLVRSEVEVYLVEKSVTISGCQGRRVSLVSLSECLNDLTLQGFKYNLEAKELRRHQTLCLANVVLSDTATLSMSSGLGLLCLSR